MPPRNSLQGDKNRIKSLLHDVKALESGPRGSSPGVFPNPAIIRKILTSIVESLASRHVSLMMEDLSDAWASLRISFIESVTDVMSEVSQVQGCLYLNFLQRCFQNMVHEASDLMVLMVLQSNGALLKLLKHQSKRAHEVLDFLFMQLLNPHCSKAHLAAQLLLKSWKWEIADSVWKMLNGALRHGHDDGNVYSVIYELILVSKDLVVGLSNNTELCLSPRRKDRLQGLQFFCKLFSAKKIPELPNPTVFYSHLWFTFLSQKVSLTEPKELNIIAKYTPDLLNQPCAEKDWCSLLFHLLRHVLPPGCCRNLVSEIIAAVQNNISLLKYNGPKSLAQLIKNFLTPNSLYEQFDETREFLIKSIGTIYKVAAMNGVDSMHLQIYFDVSSWLLSCIVHTCSSLSPTNERWTQLRQVFVKYFAPYTLDAQIRMKMLLNMWIHASFEDWSILHGMFAATHWARNKLIRILIILKDEDTAGKQRPLIAYLARQLNWVLISKNENGEFVSKRLLPYLQSNLELRSLMYKLVSPTPSCAEKLKIGQDIRRILMNNSAAYGEGLDTLLYYVTETTFDKTSMKHLVDEVDLCVIGNKISASKSENRLHIARAALRLLSEVLFMSPYLGFDTDILEKILKWSKLMNGSLSMLALRCVAQLANYQRLEIWDSDFTEKFILPSWICIIQSESRGQVKMAIKCVANHLTTSRSKVLKQIFHIISDQLDDPLKPETFERGVSALGHFAAFCPSFLTKDVESRCLSVLVQNIIGNLLSPKEPSSAGSETSSHNTWVDWQELPHSISVKVQALRSIRRCMRFCGSSDNVRETLEILQAVLSFSKEGMCLEREVDRDRLRYEAASAILYILEASEFQSMISKQLLLALSHILMDSRIEVRTLFAEKLCHGLSPYKVRPGDIGRTRGKLPPSILGLLALLGSNIWMSNEESKEAAERMVKQVLVSRHLDVMFKRSIAPLNLQKFLSINPLLVVENILATAVPIISEQPMCQSCDFSLNEDFFEENFDLLLEMAQCLKFICRLLCHPSTYGGQVTKQYMWNMANTAKETLFSSIEPAQILNYEVVFELLELTLRQYKSIEKDPLTPPVQLPGPFFIQGTEEPQQDGERLLSAPQLSKIERALKKKKSAAYLDSDSEDQNDEQTIDEGSFSLTFSSEPSRLSEESALDEGSPIAGQVEFSNLWDPTSHSTPMQPIIPSQKRRRLI